MKTPQRCAPATRPASAFGTELLGSSGAINSLRLNKGAPGGDPSPPRGGEHPSFGPQNGPTRQERRLLGMLSADPGCFRGGGQNVAHLCQRRTGAPGAERPPEAAGRGPAAPRPLVRGPCGDRRPRWQRPVALVGGQPVLPRGSSGSPFCSPFSEPPETSPRGCGSERGMPAERPLLLSAAPIEGTGTEEARDRPPGSHFLQLFFLSLVEIKAHNFAAQTPPCGASALGGSQLQQPPASPRPPAGAFRRAGWVPAASHLPSERETRARAKASRARARSSMLGAVLLVPAAAAL